MHAVITRRTGGLEVLEYEELDAPVAGDGEVLVRVRAIGLNPIDWKYRSGRSPKELPAILGSDISGTVEQSRTDVFSVGEDVFGFAASGAYAELATSPAPALAVKPAGITHEQAAALPVSALTAWQALFDRGRLESGQTVAIAGAAGGVGHIAVQLAKHAGARVVGIGGAHSRDFVLGLGADQFVDYSKEAIADAVSDADLAFDAVGGETTEALLGAVRDGGAFVTIANAAPEEQASKRGVRAELLIMSVSSEQLASVAELVVSGALQVEIAESMPLSEIRRAHELSEAGHTRGKIILTV
jgi:NADPH:quinone reductase-like Zn-dependent oxidoreductase